MAYRKQMPAIREARIPFTPDGYTALLEEKKRLLAERPDAVENLRKAREMGDLSENGYYKASRARLSFLDGRLRRLERIIRLAHIVKYTLSDKVGIGTVVVVHDGIRSVTYSIAGTYESDPSRGIISYVSPIGRMLMGREKGDTVSIVTPAGSKRLTITDIRLAQQGGI